MAPSPDYSSKLVSQAETTESFLKYGHF
jgi:hypothetical protein